MLTERLFSRVGAGLRGLAPVRSAGERRRRRRGQRTLTAIDRRLAVEAPALTSLFSMFNQLTQGEQAGGEEPLPAPARPRPNSAQVAVLLALAAVTALCLVLSSHVRGPAPRCLAASSARAASSAVPWCRV